MSEDLARGGHERNTKVTACPQHRQIPILGKTRLHVILVYCRRAADDRLARRTGQVVLDVVGERLPTPERQRAHSTLARVSALGDERVLHAECAGKLAHQGGEEVSTGSERSTGHDRPDQFARACRTFRRFHDGGAGTRSTYHRYGPLPQPAHH